MFRKTPLTYYKFKHITIHFSAANIVIDFVVADGPKRSELGCYKPPQSYYACGICPMKPEKYKYVTVAGKDHSKAAWTSTTLPANRTKEDIEATAFYLDRIGEDEARGITGRSLLFDLPGFDIVQQLVPEYMHFVCIGVVKMLCNLSISVPKKTARPSKSSVRNKVAVEHLNSKLKHIKTPAEFSRKLRRYNAADWKAEEYRNFILFYVFTFIDCIPKENTAMRSLWYYLSYLVRAYSLPDQEFAYINKTRLKELQARYVKKFRQMHGEFNCTYNLHQILHLDHIRKLGPLPLTSAFPSESCFARLRRSFAGGTPNPVKQILTGMYHRYMLGHACRKRVLIANHVTKSVDDSLFYTFINGKYRFYKAVSTGGRDVTCNQIVTVYEDKELNMQEVGVFRKYCLGDDEVSIPWKQVAGKAILVGNYVIAISNDTLRESGSQ